MYNNVEQKKNQQHTIENDGMTLHTLLGQLYGRETMFIKALFNVLSDMQQHELSPYCVGVLEYLKKEHQEGKFCAELSTFIDERLNTKSYNGGKKKGVFGREGRTQEQLQDWYTTANEAMMDACAKSIRSNIKRSLSCWRKSCTIANVNWICAMLKIYIVI
ncbi:hypothetical protein BDC45DRAFT_562751 [Circinella umbellata]|nr:hypothetical protein BDC45DRAFT_562751 [Circinella umbellata]